LPPSIQDLVPAGHVAHFVRETVRDGLDLSRIMDSYEEERGYGQQYTGRQGGCEAVKIAHDGRDFILLPGVKVFPGRVWGRPLTSIRATSCQKGGSGGPRFG